MLHSNPKINILTRTSGRPNCFKRCVDSIKSQTYKNINHIVGADDDESYEYASKLCDNVIKLEKGVKNPDYGVAHAPYNLYINKLLSEVEDGYIVFLDDDDIYTSPNVLSKIANYLTEDRLLAWKTKLPYGIVPQDWAFNAPFLIPTQICSIAYAFHSKHKWAAQWDHVKEADFRCAQRLSRLIGVMWLDEVLSEVPSVGLGEREDI